jgi:hypothetical protein
LVSSPANRRCASGIPVVRDDLEATALRLEFEADRVEGVVFNPESQSLKAGSVKTKETFAYRLEERP